MQAKHRTIAESYQRLADAWHALRERGEVPVAGMTEEVGDGH